MKFPMKGITYYIRTKQIHITTKTKKNRDKNLPLSVHERSSKTIKGYGEVNNVINEFN